MAGWLALQAGGGDGGGGGSALTTIVLIIVGIVYIAAMWRIFTKAGQPGWAAIIPIYNLWILLKVVNRPGWWLILYFIPLVNFIIGIIVMIDLAKRFGRGVGFGIGLILLPIVFLPVLAFGDSEYGAAVAGA